MYWEDCQCSLIHAGKPYAGKRMKASKPAEIKKQHPDITIEENGTICYLISIKANHDSSLAEADDVKSETVLSLCNGELKVRQSIPVSLQDINRIENLYGGSFRH